LSLSLCGGGGPGTGRCMDCLNGTAGASIAVTASVTPRPLAIRAWRATSIPAFQPRISAASMAFGSMRVLSWCGGWRPGKNQRRTSSTRSRYGPGRLAADLGSRLRTPRLRPPISLCTHDGTGSFHRALTMPRANFTVRSRRNKITHQCFQRAGARLEGSRRPPSTRKKKGIKESKTSPRPMQCDGLDRRPEMRDWGLATAGSGGQGAVLHRGCDTGSNPLTPRPIEHGFPPALSTPEKTAEPSRSPSTMA
jgi:hypothetical protein